MLQPISYHLKICNYFKEQKKTWEFFAAGKTRLQQLNEFKLELLKNTYKFDPATEKHIYDKVTFAKDRLGLDGLKVTVYQSQFADETNASVVYLEGEAHIVFSGSVIRMLDDDELLAVLSHELSHIKLYNVLNGDLEITDRIVTAIANNPQSEAQYYETARLFKLYNEVFCDRGAFSVLGKTEPVITSVVKIATGLDKISPESYINQAEEIFRSEKDTKVASVTHPENFIRARAIHLWQTEGENAEPEISRMIEGSANLDQLDILKQKDLSVFTKKFIQLFLKPKWFQTSTVYSQVKQYFPDYAADEQAVLTEELPKKIGESHQSIKEYLSYVLLDFVLVDPSLEIIPFGWAFQFAEDVDLKQSFEEIVKKEFKYTDKKLQHHKQKALAAYYEVKESAAEQIYQD